MFLARAVVNVVYIVALPSTTVAPAIILPLLSVNLTNPSPTLEPSVVVTLTTTAIGVLTVPIIAESTLIFTYSIFFPVLSLIVLFSPVASTELSPDNSLATKLLSVT